MKIVTVSCCCAKRIYVFQRQGFSYWGGGESPQQQPKICSSSPATGKIPYQIFIPPPSNKDEFPPPPINTKFHVITQ